MMRELSQIAGPRSRSMGALESRADERGVVRSWLGMIRGREWAHFALLPIAAFSPSHGEAAWLALVRGFGIAALVLAYGYLLNALGDRGSDRPGKNPTVGRDERAVKAMVLGLASCAACLSLLGPPVVRVATIVSLVSGAVYSVGPRAKRLPALGTLLNATNFAPLLWVGTSSGGAPRGMRALTVAFVCLLLQNQLLHEAADRDEDVRAGVRTTVAWLGDRLAAAVACLFGASVAVVAFAAAGAIGALALAVPFGGVFPRLLARSGMEQEPMARARRAHRVCALVSGALLFACMR